MGLDRAGLADRLREELTVLVDFPEQVAEHAALIDRIVTWLAPALDGTLDTIEALDAGFILSTVTQGGIIPDPDELDYHSLALVFVVLGRLVASGMIALPAPPC